MDKKSLIVKWLAVGIILLFIGFPVVQSSIIEGFDIYYESVYPFRQGAEGDSPWLQVAKLTPFDSRGFATSISANGDTVLVGAQSDDGNQEYAGAAYVFVRNGSGWMQQAKLFASDGAMSDSFGCSVSIDEDTAIIGAEYDDDNGLYSGSAYIFSWTGTVWTQEAKLVASDGEGWTFFGGSVSVSGDYAIVGSETTNHYTGSAYIFKRNGKGWTEVAHLVPEIGGYFGWAVSIYGDTAVVGCPGYLQNGSIFVFKLRNESWIQDAILVPLDSEVSWFGSAVSIYENTVVGGARNSMDDTGFASVFRYVGSSWIEEAKLSAHDVKPGDLFGISVSIYGDSILVGNHPDDFDAGVYIFNYHNGVWSEDKIKTELNDIKSGSDFGRAVALGEHCAFVAAQSDRDWTGAVYVFRSAIPSIVLGRFTNRSETNGFVTLESKNIWVLTKDPLSIHHFRVNEKLMLLNKFLGMITKQFIIGFFNAII